MESTDVLQGLAAAQKAIARHICEAGNLAANMPHGVAALVPMKSVMGTLGNQGAGSVALPQATDLAEEIYSGTSDWGPSMEDLIPAFPQGPHGGQLPFNTAHPLWD